MGGCETTPTDRTRGAQPSGTPGPATTTGGPLLAHDHRPPLAGIKLVRPRPAPGRALTLRALQLDPRPRGGAKPAATRKASKPVPTKPDDPQQVTGPNHHALLTEGSPMGGCSAQPNQ